MNEAAKGTATALSRREFLEASLAATGGLVLLASLPGCSRKPGDIATTKTIESNAWLRITTDNRIQFLCDRSEMGQGVYTALTMLVAEELGVVPEDIEVEFAPAGAAYVNELLGGQVTGGSTSVRDAWVKLRTAAATARVLLVQAAAQKWAVDAASLSVTEKSVVGPDNRRATFGELAEAAAALERPANVPLTPVDKYRILGRARARLDTPAKVNGETRYGIDVVLPGMKFAALAQSPALKGRAISVDDSRAKGMPGVSQIINSDYGVIVIADSWWRARKARDSLEIEWAAGPNGALDNAAIARLLHEGQGAPEQIARQDGDIAAAMRKPNRIVSAEYQLPLLAHATLEPQNCTADVRSGKCDIYAPTQVQQAAQAIAAKAAGLPEQAVVVHTTFLGGGFGRRLEVDYIPAAVVASKAVGAPVKLLWTREDDMTNDAYRPPAADKVSAALDRTGRPLAWHLELTGPSITARAFPAVVEKMIDPFAIEAAANYPYDVPNVRVSYRRQEIGIDVGYWRSVSHALNCFVAESFMDELAAAAGADPLQYRRSLLDKQPRYRAVLDRVAELAGYGQVSAGHFQGIALMEGYGTYMAQVVEISMDGGDVRIHRIVCALDCGETINPAIITSQVESSIVYGLSAALWGEITLRNGRVQQTNFDNYRVLRLNEMPAVETDILQSREAPGGIGEPATALIAPALCNALYRATGKRLRSLPLARHGVGLKV
ncbi:MAG: molybdopterin cofactor-binding domain-containing protein [Steroidobacteraceae bacterium]